MNRRLSTISKYKKPCLGCKGSLVQIQSRRPSYLIEITTYYNNLSPSWGAALISNNIGYRRIVSDSTCGKFVDGGYYGSNSFLINTSGQINPNLSVTYSTVQQQSRNLTSLTLGSWTSLSLSINQTGESKMATTTTYGTKRKTAGAVKRKTVKRSTKTKKRKTTKTRKH